MGADFIEKATPTFRKSWDRARTKLATADLFTREPSSLVCTVVADIFDGEQLTMGELLTVEVEDKSFIVRRGNSKVARIQNPLPILVEAIEKSCGIAQGKVEDVYKISRVADISLC